MDGFVAASGTQWARVYFVAYYFIAVIVCLNLFTSFVLEAVTKVDVEEWSGTPHGSLFETPFSVSVNQELLAEGGGRWRMSTDMRRSFVQDPFEQPAASPTPSMRNQPQDLQRGAGDVGYAPLASDEARPNDDVLAGDPRQRNESTSSMLQGYVASPPDRGQLAQTGAQDLRETGETDDFDDPADLGQPVIWREEVDARDWDDD